MSTATIIDNPGDNRRFQAVVTRSHLRLHALGMKHSRMPGTALLKHAAGLTGNKYKRGQYQQAVEDLTALIKELQ